MEIKYVIGVDEVGRGPLAGPVTVGIVMVPCNFDWSLVKGVNDSKKLSEKRRQIINNRAHQLQGLGKIKFVVIGSSAKTIDKLGISVSIKRSVNRGLEKVLNLYREDNKQITIDKTNVLVRLDGSLFASKKWINQETIIKGDSKDPLIGLASIVAKVSRDDYMCRVSKQKDFSVYGFDKNKGYGTLYHRQAVKKNGLSSIHRVTYCKNIELL